MNNYSKTNILILIGKLDWNKILCNVKYLLKNNNVKY